MIYDIILNIFSLLFRFLLLIAKVYLDVDSFKIKNLKILKTNCLEVFNAEVFQTWFEAKSENNLEALNALFYHNRLFNPFPCKDIIIPNKVQIIDVIIPQIEEDVTVLSKIEKIIIDKSFKVDCKSVLKSGNFVKYK